MSLGPIRRFAYEFFKVRTASPSSIVLTRWQYTHILAALLVLPFYWLHCNHRFDSMECACGRPLDRCCA
jgi:hypothetical protein